METKQENGEEKKPGLTPFQVIGSVFAAMFGVQSSKNRKRDFEQGRAGVFIAAGIIFAVIFVATIFGIVQMVMSSAGR